MKKLNSLENEVIETIKNWRSQFVQGLNKNEIDPMNKGEVEDLLDGISENGLNCYATHLFDQLNQDQKNKVARELANIGIYINFEELIAVYDTDLLNKE